MPSHSQTLARLDLLVAEARDLCRRAQDVGGAEGWRGSLGQDEAIPLAFRTVLGRQVLDWMHRAEAAVRTVKPGGDTLCGERARELRRLIDTANVAVLKRSNGHEAWNMFWRSTREIQFTGTPPER